MSLGHAPAARRRPRRRFADLTRFLLALLAVTTASACGSDGTAPDARPAHAACRSAVTTDTITVSTPDGPRSAVLSQPDGSGRRPLIVQLHGIGGTGTAFDADTGLGTLAAARGVAVVTPTALGTPTRWNFDRRPDGADDYAFVDALVRRLTDRACVDPKRVYAAGASNGAAFAGFLACTTPYRFAAVAMVIATVPPGCPANETPAMITIRGTADATQPYAGAEDVVGSWAAHDGCGPAETVTLQPGVIETRFTECDVPVALDTVTDAVHAWPGGTGANRPDNSDAGRTFPASERILDFLRSA